MVVCALTGHQTWQTKLDATLDVLTHVDLCTGRKTAMDLASSNHMEDAIYGTMIGQTRIALVASALKAMSARYW